MTFQETKKNIEGGKLGENAKSKSQEQIDLARTFREVFDTKSGKIVLEHLDKYSHINFPNYEHANAVLCTYSKIGEQTLVAYIKKMIELSKKE